MSCSPQNSSSAQKSPYSRPQYHNTDRFTPIGFSSPIHQPSPHKGGPFQRGNRQNQNFHRNSRYQPGWQHRNNKQCYVKKEESIMHFYHPEMLEDPWKLLADKIKCEVQNDNETSLPDTSRRSISASSGDINADSTG